MPLVELRQLIAAHAGRGELAIAGLHLSSVDEATTPMSSIASPIFALVAQGSKRLVFGDRVHDYGAGDYLIVTVDLPVTGQFIEASKERPALGVGLDLRPALIASLLLNMPSERPLSASSVPPLTVSRAPAELIDPVVRLLRLLDHPADLPVLAPLIEREIIWRLLTGSKGETIRQIGVTDSSLSQVGRAIRWIRDHPADSFRVEELAARANMSLSTFHRHFRAVTTLSPVQFQKKVRLQQARLLLIGGGLDVSSAAFDVGYDSPSQFIREYRREFGAPPGRDAARLRADATPGPVTILP